MPLIRIFFNPVLISAMLAWMIAQSLKLPLDYMISRRWNWALLFSAGGMPSSHSALATSTALASGLFAGFDSPVFGLAVSVAMVVIYDAAGIRRQAGIHARKINLLVNELFSGQPINEDQLKEVLGHTPLEVIGGIILGVGISLLTWFFWAK